ncbi:cell division site-positioning protein MapZ family protein [Enterococcus caccae]|uniref:Uncharacterized protein n=1 Tax=Enterococcus caccae ATCC BAA-1240 TaxID=1158612 RepID=R3W963_9ENTE|nr:cell division site-positioning protein MapZ family protein [Enterococcus caccae]EOL44416.1 hypothetical protein UC7_02460 [Enterococcus caccae ATCC BAA-1240]EOT68468.1 hypothetical protein I580_00851 [Enterococcus caccae ATCC BAA-1240]OJG28321.1 hypothetical protein RU98_GL001569 [Enterococcus caccae]
MTKQCPNCGTEIDNQKDACPKCGYSFKKGQSTEEKTPKIDAKPSEESEDTSSFSNKEKNENIEWSELKDMSIGHVMTMFNEQRPEEKTTDLGRNTNNEEKSPSNEENSKNLNDETVSQDSKADDLVNTAALDQYINDHKNDNPTVETPSETSSSVESDEKTDTDEQPELSGEPLDSKATEQDEANKNEANQKSTQPSDEKVLQEKNKAPKEEITKFAKPNTETTESKTIGPKALPTKATDIPSKSKKPEEIEMDAAPIFFKDAEEAKSAKNQFEQPVVEKKSSKEGENNSSKDVSIKNYKKMSVILAAAVVLTAGSWFAYSQTQKKSTTGGEVTQKQEKLATQTEKELRSYFTDDKQQFLKPEMVSVNPKTIKENLSALKNEANYNELETLYNKVTDKQTAITKINELFAQPIIDGSKLKDVVIKADKKVDIAKREEKDDFDKLLNQARDQAMSQYDQLQKAKASVDVFYQNNEFTGSLTRENYAIAKADVDKVKSEVLRKPLSEVLVKADKSLTEAESVVSSQQELTDQAPVQASETPVGDYQERNTQTPNGLQPDSNTFSAPNADGVYTDPVYSVNANDVSDMSNPAWSWAPGIQEKVIATCIERGYITAGAYSLQPARIINGEGYYNLYGSDNQYLVTINAKTGWFKGNASRNAGR